MFFSDINTGSLINTHDSMLNENIIEGKSLSSWQMRKIFVLKYK